MSLSVITFLDRLCIAVAGRRIQQELGRGFTEGEMAILSSLPFVLGTLANLAGGFVSGAAVRRFGMRRGRTLVGSTCLAAGACLPVLTAVVLLTLGFGVMDLMLPSVGAICLDISGPHAGAVSGVKNMSGQLGGFLCTVLFGYAVRKYTYYNLPLFVIAGMVALAAFLFARIDASRPLFAANQPEPAR